jgi:phospholipid-binding lipoprotein MlaA
MRSLRLRLFAHVAALLFCAGLAGCAAMPHVNRQQSDDPLEPLNRAVFDTNNALDTALIKPIAESYRAIFPQWARDRFRSVIDNLAEPRIFVNNLLQRRPDAAGVTFARFFINSIVGVAGMFDLATEQGFAKQSGDFGQTLYTWGVDDGPYLVLLLVGPSNLRDAFGLGVDVVTTPPALLAGHSHTVANLAIGIVDGIDLRARNIETLDEIKSSALDYYAHLKSIMQQRRRTQLLESRGVKDEPYELTDPGKSADEPKE